MVELAVWELYVIEYPCLKDHPLGRFHKRDVSSRHGELALLIRPRAARRSQCADRHRLHAG